MAIEKPYADIAGTTVFDGDMVRRGYHSTPSSINGFSIAC